jgi:hypothetical protein
VNVDLIDKHIKAIADALSNGMSAEDIIQAYLEKGHPLENIYLWLTAGKMLYDDRQSFVPPKLPFRRVT